MPRTRTSARHLEITAVVTLATALSASAAAFPVRDVGEAEPVDEITAGSPAPDVAPAPGLDGPPRLDPPRRGAPGRGDRPTRDRVDDEAGPSHESELETATAAAARHAALAAELARLEPCLLLDPATNAAVLDADCVLRRLRAHYGSLRHHRERGWLVEEIRDPDSVVRRTATAIEWSVDSGRIRVETAARRVRGFIGRLLAGRDLESPEGSTVDTWLAPQSILAMPEAEELEAVAVSTVSGEDGPRVRLDVTDRREDRFEFVVDPDTMRVDSARSERDLPDGGRHTATFEVDEVEGDESMPSDQSAADPITESLDASTDGADGRD